MASTIKQNYELVAKRWAKALMELALEDDGISKEDILDDLKEVADNIKASPELSNLINNPSVSTEEKQIVICKLFQSKVMPIVYNFLYALNLKKRIDIIDVVAQEFQKELEAINNVVRVNITSAIDISEERKQELQTKIEEKINKRIIADWHVNSDIIAGLIFNINETIIDNSIKGKLESLTKEMIKS